MPQFWGMWINRCLGPWRGADNCVKGSISVPYMRQSGILGRVMGAKSAAEPLLLVARGLRKGFSLLVARVKALRRAVRVDNFRLAQRLRMALPLYVRHLTEPVRNDIARLFEVSGLWVRNVGDRRQTKQNTLRIIRRIISRLNTLTASRRVRELLSPSLSH
jgi:hypothetical protein